MAVTEEVVDSPLEIVAFKANTKAFALLAPRYEEHQEADFPASDLGLNRGGSKCSIHVLV